MLSVFRPLAALAVLSTLGACTPLAANGDGDIIISAEGMDPPRDGEADQEGRLRIRRGPDYQPVEGDSAALFTRLEASMADRRSTAWAIVEQMLQPVELKVDEHTYQVPRWHTWYEGYRGTDSYDEISNILRIYFGELGACRADPACTRTHEQIAREAVDTGGYKIMETGLTDEALTHVLPQARGHAPEDLALGSTLFSPGFVEHVLTQAQGIEECGLDHPWNEQAPASQFSPCFQEFPRNAVMVKANWAALGTQAVPQRLRFRDVSANTIGGVITNGRFGPQQSQAVDPSQIYTVVSTSGQRFGLRSIHFSTKDTREWVWISLWWSPNANQDFGEDRPQSIGSYNNGVWGHYKMCVTTAFNERDAQPWAEFMSSRASLAEALRASHQAIAVQAAQAPPGYDSVTSWCSNPNIETQGRNASTNCIGCHQYVHVHSPIQDARMSFAETLQEVEPFLSEYPQYGRARRRLNFPGEFTWSIDEELLQDRIRSARRAEQFEWRPQP